MACWRMSMTNVPLYDTLGEESISWILEQTQLSTIFLGVEGIKRLAEMKVKGLIKSLTTLVCFDEIDVEKSNMASEAGLKLLHLNDVINVGMQQETPFKPCRGDSVITICYTSGTTGKVKGAVLTHRNFRDNGVAALHSGVFHGYQIGYAFLSYLPLAHVFERVVLYICIIGLMKVGFYHGVIAELNEDIVAIRPDVLIGVPRVFCRFYDKILQSINTLGSFKRSLVNSAINTKITDYKKNGSLSHWLYDKVVLSKIRSSFGGNMKLFVSAAAPMDSSIMEHLRVMCSCRFIQGYGQTESAGPLSISYDCDNYPGSSGPPMACSVAKVVDVPEMRYFSTDVTDGVLTPRGELCFQGVHLAKEYFKDPERTAKLYDSDGWLHTGDIAMITPSGCIKVIDRKKNIFKLQHGEYVAPEKLENDLTNSSWVLQLFIYGDSYQTYLVAIVVPNKETVMQWADEHKVEGSYEELCGHEDLNDVILKDLARLGRERKHVGYEIVKKIHVTPNTFTIENGTLTPTFKIKRSEAKNMYADVIAKMYSEPLNEPKHKGSADLPNLRTESN
eukprot:TRINITY_DN1044_c0_g2_i14.p1 TRINITY_DN1044_c0_g2~~TRINITY_DN1044_c0_g2_i14.p1  ORF type:complete len:560 (-),score=170.28 TRINITY_DN1044_c0_g2_i14:178-1857(-)